MQKNILFVCTTQGSLGISRGEIVTPNLFWVSVGKKLTLLSTFKISPKHQHTLQPAALTFREGILKYACLICTETV